jgi:hypothetical protein
MKSANFLIKKALKCICIGYGDLSRIEGYMLYDLNDKKIFVSCGVIFQEDSIICG